MWGCAALLVVCLNQHNLLDALPGKADFQAMIPKVLELEWRTVGYPSAWQDPQEHDRLLLGRYDLERYFAWQEDDLNFAHGGFVEAGTDREASLALFGLVGYSEQLQGYKDVACFRQWRHSRVDRCESMDFGDKFPVPVLGAGLEWRAGDDMSVRFEAVTRFDSDEFQPGGMVEFKLRF